MRAFASSAFLCVGNLRNKQSCFYNRCKTLPNSANTGNNIIATIAAHQYALRFITETPPPAVIIGNERNGLMNAVHVSWTDLVGQDGLHNVRLSGGPLLSMADMCAAHVAHKVCAFAGKRSCVNNGSNTTGSDVKSKSYTEETTESTKLNSSNADTMTNTSSTNVNNLHNKYLCCTVGVTNTVFHCPVLHGDAIRLNGRAVHCGNSSLGIHIRYFRSSPATGVETFLGETFFTMVTITPDLKAAKVVPAMKLTDPFDIAMHSRYNRVMQVQKETDAEVAKWENVNITPESIDCPINQSKSTRVSISSTRTIANRIFFSAYLNNNNTVFGGELMSWMERHAVYCARVFTNNKHVYTLGMHNVTFNEPLFATDWVSLEANVIYVRNSTMEVDVRLRAERETTGVVVTNRASFIIIAFDDIGQKANISTGIDLTSATQEELRLYAQAKTRYYLRLKRKEQTQNASPK